MRAVYIEQHGAVEALKVSEVPRPSIGAGEVLVRVDAAGINPSDVGSVQGRFPESKLPRIAGRDFAGEVVDGPLELVGSEVWGTGGDLGISRDGTHAEYLVIPRQAVARRPRNLSVEEAAAVGVPFVTAFSALVRLAQLKAGEWVIISGTTGSVGQAGVQIAHAKGARVIALVKDATDRRRLGSSSVEAIAQSDQGDLNQVAREMTNGKGANVALNAVGGSVFAALLEALAVGGRQVVFSVAGGRESALDILSFYKNQLAVFGLDTQKLDVTECAAILNEIAPLFESGALQPPVIAEKFQLAEAAQAYQRVTMGGSGKVVLVMALQKKP